MPNEHDSISDSKLIHFFLLNNDDEWIQEIDEIRDTKRMFAIDNIEKEQKIQNEILTAN